MSRYIDKNITDVTQYDGRNTDEIIAYSPAWFGPNKFGALCGGNMFDDFVVNVGDYVFRINGEVFYSPKDSFELRYEAVE